MAVLPFTPLQSCVSLGSDLRKAGPFGRILVTSLGMDYGAGRQVTAAFDTPPVKVCVFLIL